MARLREECGVVGILGDPEAANLVYLGLFAQQHRGQEGCGIVSLAAGEFHVHKSFSLVSDAFNPEILGRLTAKAPRRR